MIEMSFALYATDLGIKTGYPSVRTLWPVI